MLRTRRVDDVCPLPVRFNLPLGFLHLFAILRLAAEARAASLTLRQLSCVCHHPRETRGEPVDVIDRTLLGLGQHPTLNSNRLLESGTSQLHDLRRVFSSHLVVGDNEDSAFELGNGNPLVELSIGMRHQILRHQPDARADQLADFLLLCIEHEVCIYFHSNNLELDHLHVLSPLLLLVASGHFPVQQLIQNRIFSLDCKGAGCLAHPCAEI
mmetsp:Transcript_35833/g.80733  ORF Transcript_35833/g.80733 Transcript_35833/m.80733 type:complete len:212 (-) Transcript_35833:771-1406(-)